MEEKIRVSVPENLYALLKKDCEDFKVVKPDGSPNMNAFINGLITNYYEEFACAEEELYDQLRKAVEIAPEYYRETIFQNTLKVFIKRSEGEKYKGGSKVFSFKPTKNSLKAVLFIQNVLSQSQSLSSYYRRLFASYSEKTKTEREKIIFRENYELLSKAISKGVRVCIVFQSGETVSGVSVYSVSPAKDELFNYVLMYNGRQNITARLASLSMVTLLSEKSQIPEANIQLFRRQVECAAQYPMYSSDRQPIRVQLTEKGQKLFSKIYLYRPAPVSTDGDIYTFNCSANQLLYYFERFGDSALILEPRKLGVFMRNYYYFAYKKYKNHYPKD